MRKLTIPPELGDREEARREKQWARADEIRGELKVLGVEVMDGQQGATWRVIE